MNRFLPAILGVDAARVAEVGDRTGRAARAVALRPVAHLRRAPRPVRAAAPGAPAARPRHRWPRSAASRRRSSLVAAIAAVGVARLARGPVRQRASRRSRRWPPPSRWPCGTTCSRFAGRPGSTACSACGGSSHGTAPLNIGIVGRRLLGQEPAADLQPSYPARASPTSATSTPRPARRHAARASRRRARAATSRRSSRATTSMPCVVATPPSRHHAMALAALRAGKHVWVEKPLALTAADGRELVDAARAAGPHPLRRRDLPLRPAGARDEAPDRRGRTRRGLPPVVRATRHGPHPARLERVVELGAARPLDPLPPGAATP